MKRPAISALAAAVMALALLPGGALANPPGSADQDSGAVTGGYSTDAVLVQTFTAGRTGALTHIELYCSGIGSAVDIVLVFGGMLTHSGQCPATAAWTDFVLVSSYLVAQGNTYPILIDWNVTPFTIGTADYAGGAGALYGPPQTDIPGVSDFAFRTYVQPLQTTANTWNPASVAPGVSTPASLTTSVSFDQVSLGPLAAPIFYQVQLMQLPSWFAPTGGLSCTGPINPGDCSLATLQAPPGIQWQSTDGAAATLTLVISGTAAPGAGDWTESAEIYSCVLGNSDGVVPPTGTPYFSFGMCDTVTADLVVGQATPPPTVTAGGSESSGAGLPLWWLPAGLCALLSWLLMVRRQSRLIR
jgi:hypothetical protein